MRGIFEKPKASGVWWIDYADAVGRRHREKVGRKPVALHAYRQRKLEIREGKFTPPERKPTVTFADLARARMEQGEARFSKATRKTYRSRLKRILAALGSLPANAVTPERIDTYLSGIRRAGQSASSVNQHRRIICTIFALAVRDERIAANPTLRVKRFKEDAKRVRFLSPEEESRLRGVIREEAPEHEAELDLALHTGLRRGEQFTLARENVDLERGILTVNGKSGQRRVRLNAVARAAVQGLLERPGDYIGGASGPGQPDWRRWFERAVKKAVILNFHWHDLRHTFASRLVMAGVGLKDVQELMGHHSVTMTERYMHLSPEHLQESVDRLIA